LLSIGAITIITTFLSPYVIMVGWKASNMLSHDREGKSAADTMREEEGEKLIGLKNNAIALFDF
jgi:hypothetical protein